MVPAPCLTTAPVPPPSYQRALHKQSRALPLSALTLVTPRPLLDLCRRAVRRASTLRNPADSSRCSASPLRASNANACTRQAHHRARCF